MTELFTRFVEIGRVAMITFGDDANKLVAILEILDQNRVLVEGPSQGVPRQVVPMARITLTPLKLKIAHGVRHAGLVKAWTEAKVAEKFAESAWGKKLAKRATRRSLSDFDRFKVMVLKKKRSALVNKLSKPAKKTATTKKQ